MSGYCRALKCVIYEAETETDMRKNTSREKMKQCLLDLLKKRPITEISVKELCEASGFHRSTFYDNYETIYDLYRELHYDVFYDVLAALKDAYFVRALSVEGMVDVISCYEMPSPLHFLLTRPGNAVFFDAYLLDYFEEHLQLVNADFITKCQYKIRTIAGIMAIREWLTKDKPCSKKALAGIILATDRA